MSAVAATEDVTATACAWCGASLADAARLPGRARCASCGVATTDPWPSESTLAAAYGGPYRPCSGRFAGGGDAVLRWSRGALARRLDRIAPAGPILDVGSGDGALLDALERRGRDAVGLERGAGSDPRVRAVELEEVRERFAAVVFWHSLEHLRAPSVALAHARELLVPGGALVVAIPNAASFQARLFGERWLALDLPRHLVHVPAPALLARLGALGLRVGRVSHLRGGQVAFGWLHGLVRTLPGHPDLYDAIRRPEARAASLPPAARAGSLAAAAALAPLAVAASGLEAALRRGGSVYVEAFRG